MSSQEWKLPLNLAITFHVLIALATVYLPGLLDTKPRFEDIYTVSLVNLSEMPVATPPAAENTEPPPTPPKSVSENAVSIAPPKQVVPPAPPKAISLKPSKRKVKRKVETPAEPRRDLNQLRRQKLAEMIRAEQQAAEEARILNEEAQIEKRLAEAAQRRLAQVKSAATSTNTNMTQARTGGNAGQLSAVENQYYSTVMAQLKSYWSLPEYRAWNPNLKSTIVITVNADGTIVDSFFENKSGDRTFDNEVTKALRKAGKLSPIPGALKLKRIEIGLHFTPGGIRSNNR